VNNIDYYCDDILITKDIQQLSCNAGQARFLAARIEILAGGGKPTAGGAEPP